VSQPHGKDSSRPRKEAPGWFWAICLVAGSLIGALALFNSPAFLGLGFWVALGLGIWWAAQWSGWQSPSTGPTPGTPLYEWEMERRREQRHEELLDAIRGGTRRREDSEKEGPR
jgi:hypothetical protein